MAAYELGNLHSLYRSYLEQKLFNSKTNDIAKGDIVEITPSYTLAFSQHPIDSKKFIHDSIYENPLTVSCTFQIPGWYYQEFMTFLKTGNQQDGFILTGQDGIAYDQLYYAGHDYGHYPTMIGSYAIAVNFIQVNKITGQLYSEVTVMKKSDVVIDSAKQNKGEVAAKDECITGQLFASIEGIIPGVTRKTPEECRVSMQAAKKKAAEEAAAKKAKNKIKNNESIL